MSSSDDSTGAGLLPNVAPQVPHVLTQLWSFVEHPGQVFMHGARFGAGASSESEDDDSSMGVVLFRGWQRWRDWTNAVIGGDWTRLHRSLKASSTHSTLDTMSSSSAFNLSLIHI